MASYKTWISEEQTVVQRIFTSRRGLLTALGCLMWLLLTVGPLRAQDIKIALKADSGKFAARCANCIPKEAYPDNMAVHATDLSQPSAQWFLRKLSNGNYALKSVDSGKYAARCNNCIPGASYPDSVFVHANDSNQAYAQWKLERLTNGKYALRSADSGKYAARCSNCAPGALYPDNVFFHELETSSSSPWAQWEIIIIP